MEEAAHNAKVVSVTKVTHDLMVMRIKRVSEEVFEFKAGQYVAIGIFDRLKNEWVKRAYSIASKPGANEAEFFIARVPQGKLTPQLFDLEEGSDVWLAPKIVGHFVLSPESLNKHIFFIATGTGIAPFISMIKSGVCGDAKKAVTLIHGVRFIDDLGYSKELSKLAEENMNFSYIPVVSRDKDKEWNGQRGHVQDVIDSASFMERFGNALTPDKSHFYLCGNPAMIESMCEKLEAKGFKENARNEPGQIFVERYW